MIGTHRQTIFGRHWPRLIAAALLLFLVLGFVIATVARSSRSPLSKARRLVTSGDIVGWTTEELRSEFGKRVQTDYFSDWDLVYLLGPSSSYMAVDNSWLVVKINDAGEVVTAQVVED